MNIKKLFTSPVFWSVVALVSSACWCGEESTTQSAKILSAPETQEPPQAKILCPMEWTSLTSSSDAGEMPATGMVSFDWTDHPTANSYELTVITPNNSPVYYDTDGSAKDLFLENYSQTGNYQVVVTAVGTDGLAMCSITMNFNMPVVSGNDKPNNNDGEDEPVSIIPSNPIIPPTPTEDPPK